MKNLNVVLVLVLLLLSPESLQAKASMESFEEMEFEDYEKENQITIHDPLEKFNRKVFVFNEVADKYLLEHIARLYRENLPKNARNALRNFLQNLYSPISLLNSIAQGKSENSMATFSSFLINSTLGIGGFIDVAHNKNIRYNREDFGQTLGFYGVGSGIYLVLPILGPSSGRDFSGTAFDSAINPIGFNIIEIGEGEIYPDSYSIIGINILSGIDKRESLLDVISDIRKESFDPYATIRSAYLQKRQSDIKN